MSVEFTNAGEHRVHAYLEAVLKAYGEGRTGLNTAKGTLFTAMQLAARDDAHLATHMRNWVDAVKPPVLP